MKDNFFFLGNYFFTTFVHKLISSNHFDIKNLDKMTILSLDELKNILIIIFYF